MGYNPRGGAGTFTIYSFSAVPEPSGGILSMCALLGLLCYWRTKDLRTSILERQHGGRLFDILPPDPGQAKYSRRTC